MNQVIETILARRSCRSFSAEAVAEDTVQTLLDCALAAPSGMNRQTWQFTAVVNRDKIQRLAAAVAHALGRDDGYNMYNPAVLIITSNDMNSAFKEVDNACAMENIYLACSSLGLGCVWINQLKDCFNDPAVRAVLNEFGIPAGHGVFGCAAVGICASAPAPKEIKAVARIVK